MELGKAWDIYKEHNLLYSENARKLAFAVGAICWFFRIETDSVTCTEITFPPFIKFALLFIVLFVLSDLTQYLYQTFALRRHIKREEKMLKQNISTCELREDMLIQISEKLFKPALILLIFKTTVLYIAGFLLLSYFLKIIAP